MVVPSGVDAVGVVPVREALSVRGFCSHCPVEFPGVVDVLDRCGFTRGWERGDGEAV